MAACPSSPRLGRCRRAACPSLRRSGPPPPGGLPELAPLGPLPPGGLPELAPLGPLPPGGLPELAPLGPVPPDGLPELAPLGPLPPGGLPELAPLGPVPPPGGLPELAPLGPPLPTAPLPRSAADPFLVFVEEDAGLPDETLADDFPEWPPPFAETGAENAKATSVATAIASLIMPPPLGHRPKPKTAPGCGRDQCNFLLHKRALAPFARVFDQRQEAIEPVHEFAVRHGSGTAPSTTPRCTASRHSHRAVSRNSSSAKPVRLVKNSISDERGVHAATRRVARARRRAGVPARTVRPARP